MTNIVGKLRAYRSEVTQLVRSSREQTCALHFVGQTDKDLGLYYYLTQEEGLSRVTTDEEILLQSTWSPPTACGVNDHPVAIAQAGLKSYNRYRSTGDERFFDHSLAGADWLLDLQREDGSWRYSFEFVDLSPGWASAMAQGQAASLLLRVHQKTRQPAYLESAERALSYALLPISEGGTLGAFPDGTPFLEEYPESRVSPLTLNGSIFALWGIRDLALAASDQRAMEQFFDLSRVIADHLGEWDTGSWTLYSLRRDGSHVAPPNYHCVHIVQARVQYALTGDRRWRVAAKTWERYYFDRFGRNAVDIWWRDLQHRVGVLRQRTKETS